MYKTYSKQQIIFLKNYQNELKYRFLKVIFSALNNDRLNLS